jgi:ActR/RegA family two-component response regulator
MFLLWHARELSRGVPMSELQTLTAETTAVPTTAVSVAHPLVLIADADPQSLLRRARQLTGRGYRVSVARTSFETIVKASCILPDLILVDGSLGDSGAQETSDLLSTCPATAHIPIMRLSPGRRLPARLVTVTR